MRRDELLGELFLHSDGQGRPQGDSHTSTDSYVGSDAHQVQRTAGTRALRQQTCLAEKTRTPLPEGGDESIEGPEARASHLLVGNSLANLRH